MRQVTLSYSNVFYVKLLNGTNEQLINEICRFDLKMNMAPGHSN